MHDLPSGIPISDAAMPVQPPQPQVSAANIMADLSNKYTSQQSQEDEQRAQLITKLAEESPATVAEIIQVWLNADEKRNG